MSTTKTTHKSTWLSLGSILAAMLASACCWLPLLLISFGASAAGLSAKFEELRPWFLGLTSILLATSFYLLYFRKESCAEDSACAQPRPRLRRLDRAMLWLSTLVVVAFAFFPNYMGAMGSSSELEASSQTEASILSFTVEGMTCEACSVPVRQALESVPGVLAASIDFESSRALIRPDGSAPPKVEALTQAVEEAGYTLIPAPK